MRAAEARHGTTIIFITCRGFVRCLCLLWLTFPGPTHSAVPSLGSADNFSRPAAQDWPTVGGDWNNTRYSTLTQIDAHTLKKLGVAWISRKFLEGGLSRVTPVVKDGLMFITAGRDVYALNAKTGETVWHYRTIPDVISADYNMKWNSPSAIPNNKGVGLGQGLVFVGLRDGHVIALKQRTGERVWARQTGIDEPKIGQWASAAPTYFQGSVFSGLSDGDHHLRGRLVSLDARSGEERWHLFSIPAPGEPGHETWPAYNDTWRFGGGGVFTTPPVDPELGTVYFTTGNAVPPFAGDWRPGDNLYTSSVLAVDIETGRLKWYYQLVHHDVFDSDIGAPVILYDVRAGGRWHKALAVLRGDGYLFQLDRQTGKPILPIVEQPVPQLSSQKTSPTQPYPVDADSVLMSCEQWKQEKIPSGFVLGCMWTPPAAPPPSTDPPNVLAPQPTLKGLPMAYSPQTGYFYVQGFSYLSWPRRAQDPYFDGSPGFVPGLKTYFDMAAIDSRTGRRVWKKHTDATASNGAPIVTAGGILFRALMDGTVEADDARTGDVLWRFQTRMSGNLTSPSTYEVDGEQYLAVAMGSTVWAFRLGGNAPTPLSPSLNDMGEAAPDPVVDTHEIATTSLERSRDEPGMRYFVDEFTFSPPRARVSVGTQLLFVNSGTMRHEIIAQDGSWGTGPLSPTEEAWVTFDKPGEYRYICKDHPWSYGQITVVAQNSIPQSEITPRTSGASTNSRSFTEQAMQGRSLFTEKCGPCHGDDLKGRSSVPSLAGQAFLSHWRGSTVGDLFDRIRTTMPQASPGSLDRRAYLDIVAYLLEANVSTPQGGALDDDPQTLENLVIATGSH